MTGISCISAAARGGRRCHGRGDRVATAALRPAIWGSGSDAHIEPLARIARFVESQGAVPGIQIAHAGRKASCDVPWRGGRRLTESEGGWAVIAPSAIPFNSTDPAPIALDQAGIDGIVASFEAAAGRALEAGFKVVEIHAAHGYLLHEFLSPLANFRSDAYGGSLENRMRLPLRVAETVRALASRAGSRSSCAFPPPTGSRAVGISSNQSSSPRAPKSAAST